MGKKNKDFDKGKECFYNKQYEKAEKYLLKTINEDFAFGAAHFLLGKTYAFLSKYEKAIEYLDNAISFTIHKEESLRLKMNCLKQLGRNEEAEEINKKLDEIKSKSTPTPTNDIKLAKQEYEAMLKMNTSQLYEILKSKPYNLGIWILVANSAEQNNNIQALYTIAEDMMKKDPYNYFSYIFLIDKEMYGQDFSQKSPELLIKYMKRLLSLRGAGDNNVIEFIEERLIQIIAVMFTSKNFDVGVDLVNFIFDSKFPIQSKRLIGFCGTILQGAGIIGDINDIGSYMSNYKPNIARLVEIGAQVTKEAEMVGK